jgi:hypothetical protein
MVDLPTMAAVQGYTLGGSEIGDRVALAGEPAEGSSLRIHTPEAFAALPHGGIDILYNQDSLPEIEPEAARAYVRGATDLGIPIILSINQEAHLATHDGHQTSVPELIAQVGGYRSTSRHRHWLRQGYLEEIYESV